MKTKSTAKLTVGTMKKSIDAKHPTWFLRNTRHVCDGGLGWRVVYLETAAWELSIPSLSNSPWIRGAPHNGFSWLMRAISLRMSGGIAGRPGWRVRDFHLQYR